MNSKLSLSVAVLSFVFIFVVFLDLSAIIVVNGESTVPTIPITKSPVDTKPFLKTVQDTTLPVDTTPPIVTVPEHMIVEATGPEGRIVD